MRILNEELDLTNPAHLDVLHKKMDALVKRDDLDWPFRKAMFDAGLGVLTAHVHILQKQLEGLGSKTG